MKPKFLAYETPSFGRHARLVLLIIAVALVIWFGFFAVKHQTGIICLAANLVLLVSLITLRGFKVLRIVLLILMSANVLAFTINPVEVLGNKRVDPPDWSAFLLLVCLVVAATFEIVAWVKSTTRKILFKTLTWGVLLIPALVYILAIPIFDSIWTTIEADKKTLALKDPNWSLINEASFRAAKLAVFSVFMYLGACLGSFLNVAAYCIPRGEAIGVRDSKCPKCDTKLSRIDNLPIFSYINLGAKCRNCSVPIPPRYLIVEIVVGLIFGSLFLYQLVTGCANVPSMKMTHTGILWVILYPKWPAIGIYFFNSFFMCAVLVLALMEKDDYPLKRIFALITGIAFFAAAAAYIPIQPIPLFEHLPGVSVKLSPVVEQLVKLVVGGAVGALIGRTLGMLFSAKHSSFLTFAFLLTGVVLGWQALIQVTIVFAIVWAIANCIPKIKAYSQNGPTTLLLAAIAIHHPFWNTIAQWWRFK